MVENLAAIAAFILPLWNIPLIVRMIQRKSSKDISFSWAMGVWICFLFMAPAGFHSKDLAFRVFNIMNMIFFTLVVICVWFYRGKEGSH
ncbi:MAG: hypothetical protein EXS63_02910 [Candidatus Omnitrophica bacterium]|nr:hypothetical protein [Candidatus Omnitrophota bacterium]